MRHLRFANVVSVLALFVALGGTGYAVSKLDGSDIQNRSIPGKKLKKKTLTAKEVRTAAVSIRTRQLRLSKGGRRRGRGASAAGAGGQGELVRLSAGQNVVIVENGPFAIRASCEQAGGGHRATLVATSSAAGTRTGSGGFVGPGNPNLIYVQEGSGSIFQGAINTDTLVAPSGQMFTFGGYTLGVNVFNADCVATLYAIG